MSHIEAAAALWTRITGATAPAATDADGWLECLARDLPPRPALALAEHLFGVLPLIEACFGDAAGDELTAAVRRGERHAALGCFTPNPEHSWHGAILRGRRHREGAIVDGGARIATAAEVSLVLVELDGEEHPRWILVDHDDPGASLRAARQGTAPPRSGRPCWLHLDGVQVSSIRVSESTDLDPLEGAAGRCLDSYAGLHARLVAAHARHGVRALRRVSRITHHGETAWKTAQLPAFGLTELEIELGLLEAAVKIADEAPAATRPHGLALAASAARVLELVLRWTTRLDIEAGLAVDGPFNDAAGLEAFLGGGWMIERELAGTLGL